MTAGLLIESREDPDVNEFLTAGRYGTIFGGGTLPAHPLDVPNLSHAPHLGMGAAAPAPGSAAAGAYQQYQLLSAAPLAGDIPSTSLGGLGHGFADWIVGVGHHIVGFAESNLLGSLVAGLALYVIFAPDLTGRTRV